MPKVSKIIEELEKLKNYEDALWRIINKMNSDYSTREFMIKTFNIDIIDARELCSYLSLKYSQLKTQLYESEINL